MAAPKLKKTPPAEDTEMRIVFETDLFAVIDGFLSPEDFEMVWNYFQFQGFARVDSGVVHGEWLFEDGGVLRGPTVGYKSKWAAEYPTQTGIDLVIKTLADNAYKFEALIGSEKKDWESFTAFPALYPRETGLLWHRDSPDNTGSYTFYAHPYWNMEWGGHLLISDESTMHIPTDHGVFLRKPLRAMGGPHEISPYAHLDNEDANRLLMEKGVGSFIAPKPNRLVVIKGGAPHSVAKVNPSAGKNLRASVSGFFKRPGKFTR